MGGAVLTLSHLAREIASDVGGAAHSLDEVGETAYAIDVGEQHALLLLAHASTFALSLPIQRQWSFATIADYGLVRREVDEALQSYHAARPRTPGMADAMLALAPLMRELTGKSNSVRFPGTPHPREGWLHAGASSVGVFLVDEGVQVTIWVEGEASSQELDDIGQLASLPAWAKPKLEAQRSRGADAPKRLERANPDAPPSVEEVLAHLRAGGRYVAASSRYEQIYFWEDGRVLCDSWEEGTTRMYAVSEAELARLLKLTPDTFR
jgi:hypothetical protein